MRRQATLKKYSDPDYAGLTNVVFHSRAENLVTNTTNSAGVVDVSGNITKIISTHTTTHEFDSNGTAPTLSGSGVNKSMVFGGAGRMRHNGLNSVWNAFHHNATLANLKTTIHGVVKIGTGSNPNAIYGVCGNNGASTNNKGISIFYDDRSSTGRRNFISHQITRGTNAVVITFMHNNNVFIPNQWVDFWIEIDKSKDSQQETRLFLNGHEYTVGNDVDSNITVTGPTFAMEIGGCGNATITAVMELKEITFMTGVMTDAFRTEFIRNRMNKYKPTILAHSVDSIPLVFRYRQTYTLSESRYYLPLVVCQNPTALDTIVAVFKDTTAHTFDSGGKISMIKSIDRGLTWSSKTTIYDPASTPAPMSVSAGYSANGRLHLFIDVHTAVDNTSTDTAEYWYSDNDGTSWTSTDITSIMPADSLATYRFTDRIIENDGVLMGGFYKFTAEGDFTESAIYIFRSTDGGANWSSVTVKAKSTTYRNEISIVGLSSTRILAVVRDEVTHEWHQYLSAADNGATTFTDVGAVTFGETLTRESPPSLRKFQISGSDVIACDYALRDRDQMKTIYGLPAGLISGVSGWNNQTRHINYMGAAEVHLHYGTTINPYNDFRSYGIWCKDEFPSSGGGGTVNELAGFRSNSIQYSTVKSLLGL